MLILGLISLVLMFLLLGIGLYRSSSKYAIEQRIEQIKTTEGQTTEEQMEKPFAHRVLLPIAEGIAKLFRGYTPSEVSDKNQKRLVMAGLYPRVTSMQFVGLCWFSAAACVVLMFMLLVALGRAPSGQVQLNNPINIAYLLIGAMAGYILPQFSLSKKVQRRQEEIQLALPYAIDLLSISVEAGMGFDAAVGYTMRKVKGALTEEFGKTLNEIRLGKPRLEALDDLGNRTGVEDLKIFITAVVHASRLGGSITNTLRIQADSMRVRRRQRAQEQAMKAPVKLVIPLVFFIFPALFVVILGPALLSVMQQLK